MPKQSATAPAAAVSRFAIGDHVSYRDKAGGAPFQIEIQDHVVVEKEHQHARYLCCWLKSNGERYKTGQYSKSFEVVDNEEWADKLTIPATVASASTAAATANAAATSTASAPVTAPMTSSGRGGSNDVDASGAAAFVVGGTHAMVSAASAAAPGGGKQDTAAPGGGKKDTAAPGGGKKDTGSASAPPDLAKSAAAPTAKPTSGLLASLLPSKKSSSSTSSSSSSSSYSTAVATRAAHGDSDDEGMFLTDARTDGGFDQEELNEAKRLSFESLSKNSSLLAALVASFGYVPAGNRASSGPSSSSSCAVSSAAAAAVSTPAVPVRATLMTLTEATRIFGNIMPILNASVGVVLSRGDTHGEFVADVVESFADHLLVLEGAPPLDVSAPTSAGGGKRRAPPVSSEDWSLTTLKGHFLKPTVKQIKSRWSRFKESYEEFHFVVFQKFMVEFPDTSTDAFKAATTVANMMAAVSTWLPYLKKKFEESFDAGGTFGPIRIFQAVIKKHEAPITDAFMAASATYLEMNSPRWLSRINKTWRALSGMLSRGEIFLIGGVEVEGPPLIAEALTEDGHDAGRKMLRYTEEYFIEREFGDYLFNEFFPFMLVHTLKDDPVLRTCLNAKGLALMAKMEADGVEATRPGVYVQTEAVAQRIALHAATIAAASAASGKADGAVGSEYQR